MKIQNAVRLSQIIMFKLEVRIELQLRLLLLLEEANPVQDN